MKLPGITISRIAYVVLLTCALTVFFFLHESLPKPVRSITAILAAPTAIASGISYYFNLGIAVYQSLAAILTANFIASAAIVVLVMKFRAWQGNNGRNH